jgi:hypothetical protein
MAWYLTGTLLYTSSIQIWLVRKQAAGVCTSPKAAKLLKKVTVIIKKTGCWGLYFSKGRKITEKITVIIKKQAAGGCTSPNATKLLKKKDCYQKTGCWGLHVLLQKLPSY